MAVKKRYVIGKTTCKCGCGLDIDPRLNFILESLSRFFRENTGKSIVVTSGARCPAHNKKVGGVASSAHVSGLAVDVAFANSYECYLINQYLYQIGIQRIGLNFEKSFIHFDIDDTKPKPVYFKY